MHEQGCLNMKFDRVCYYVDIIFKLYYNLKNLLIELIKL